jgi:tetratricopeptide (TPR) repeat protein
VRTSIELYEKACAHDREGREAEAAPLYEEALAVGLGDPERPRALLGLGSTYRNLGRYDDAVRTLEAAVAEYPERAELGLFLALALRSAGREPQAFRLLGELVVANAELHGYERAASLYLSEVQDVAK